MKKIGVITFQFAHNFGAVLQCWALQETLKSFSDNVSVVNYCPKYHTKNYSIFPLNGFSKSKIDTNIRIIISGLLHLNERIKRKKHFNKFSRLLNLSIVLKESDDALNYISDNYDIVFCGSDQIWNYNITHGRFDPVYFAYSKEYRGKRIGYGVSVGDAKMELFYEQLLLYTKGMDYISAREKLTGIQLQSLLNRNIEIVSDPTMLLEKSRYESIAVYPKCQKYILLYLLSENSMVNHIIDILNKNKEYIVIDISPSKMSIVDCKRAKGIGPFEFLGYVHDASYVLTNSFHGTVFSIIFNKPFLCLTHKTRSERIVNLLNDFSLSDRLVYTVKDAEHVIKSNIQYDFINKILVKRREESISYLKDIIK